MALTDALARNIDAVSIPNRKKKLLANTPLKHFLRPIIEEAMIKRMQLMQQAQQPISRPSRSPLETALGNKREMV